MKRSLPQEGKPAPISKKKLILSLDTLASSFSNPQSSSSTAQKSFKQISSLQELIPKLKQDPKKLVVLDIDKVLYDKEKVIDSEGLKTFFSHCKENEIEVLFCSAAFCPKNFFTTLRKCCVIASALGTNAPSWLKEIQSAYAPARDLQNFKLFISNVCCKDTESFVDALAALEESKRESSHLELRAENLSPLDLTQFLSSLKGENLPENLKFLQFKNLISVGVLFFYENKDKAIAHYLKKNPEHKEFLFVDDQERFCTMVKDGVYPEGKNHSVYQFVRK